MPPAAPPRADPPRQAGPATAPAEPPTAVSFDAVNWPTSPGYHVMKADARIEGRPTRFKFGLWLPGGYEARPAWPVVVSLHNKGQIGGDANGTLTGESLPFLLTHDGHDGRWQGDTPADPVDLHHAAPFICVVPQCPTAHTWADPSIVAVLDQLLDAVDAHCRASRDQTYLTGFSFGASNTWAVAAGLPGRFAAIAPIDGRAMPDPAAAVAALAHTAVYQVIGGSDRDFTPEAQRMIVALGAAPHPDFAFDVVPGGNHFCYGSVYTDPAFWGWMFAHHRLPSRVPPSPPKDRGKVALGPAAVVPTGDPPRSTVSFDAHALPTAAGLSIVPATLDIGGHTVPFDFGLYLPPGYPHAVGYHGGPVPVVVNLHWRQYCGGPDEQVWADTLPALLDHADYGHEHRGERPADPVPLTHVAPVICVMPHCPAGYHWESPGMAQAIGQLIDQLVPAVHADPDRVCLTGVSYGGSSTWVVAQQIADRLAAVVPVDGRRTSDPAATAAALRYVGVYLTAGDVDGDFTNDTRVMAAALTTALHPDLVYHEVRGGNHFCYGSTYHDPAFWAWLEAQRRRPHPPVERPAVVARPPEPGPATVSVSIPADQLPRHAGYAVVRPTVRVDGQVLSVPVGVWLPTRFPHFATPLPVIVSLHNRYAVGMDGSDGALRGEGLPMILAHGNPNRGEHGDVPDHPVNPANDEAFIGVFPQCPQGHSWEAGPMPAVVDGVVAAVLAGYGPTAADPDRVYCTGWSYGGSSAWAVVTAHPDRFAAVAVNDGRAMPDPAAAVARLKDVAVYVAVGDHDGVFVDEERRMLDALSAARHPNFVQRVVPHADHAAYQAVYADPAFWGWLMAQRRHPAER